MKRNVEWVERMDDGIKRTVRVSFPGRDKVKWQFKLSDRSEWDYDSAPSSDDWDTLEGKLEGMYNRRRAPWETLQLVRRLRSRARDSGAS